MIVEGEKVNGSANCRVQERAEMVEITRTIEGIGPELRGMAGGEGFHLGLGADEAQAARLGADVDRRQAAAQVFREKNPRRHRSGTRLGRLAAWLKVPPPVCHPELVEGSASGDCHR